MASTGKYGYKTGQYTYIQAYHTLRDWFEINLVLELAENYFAEELVGILWTEFKLFSSNWKRFDFYFPLLKPKKKSSFFFWMKANPGPNLALKLASNENYFTEKLVGVLWTELKLLISNWNRFDLHFPLLKPKNWLVFLVKANLCQNLALKLCPNENYFTKEQVGISWTEFKLSISNWKRFDLYLPLLKPKKPSSFFTSLPPNLWMKAWNLSANLTLNNSNSVHKIPTSSSVK